MSTADAALPRRAQRMVAYLALKGPMPRLLTAEALWPETTERLALSNLRSTVHQIRVSCPGLLSHSTDPLDLAADTIVDVRQFHDLWESENSRHTPNTAPNMENPQDAQDAQDAEDAERVRLLLDGGELLPGWYDDWVLSEQERMRQLRLRRLEEEALRSLRSGQPARALTLAHCATRLDPLRESAQRTLIEAHLEMGNRVDALRAYTTFAANSQREFGVGPSSHLEVLIMPLLVERSERLTQLAPSSPTAAPSRPGYQSNNRPTVGAGMPPTRPLTALVANPRTQV
jgi:DNA-binding SARP family transcriptional activator